MRSEAAQVIDWILRHHETLPDQPIRRKADRKALEALLNRAPSERGRPLPEVLGDFEAKIAPYACRVNHPRFLAFVPGAPAFASILGDILCAGTNFFAGVWHEAAGPSQVELTVLDWFRDWLGLPEGTAGILTGGGSEANLTALVVAREQLGQEDRARAILYFTEQRHWSIDRAAKVMGLRAEQLRPLVADADFRLDAATLREAVRRDRELGLRPWAAVANAGSTSTGTVDALHAVADCCADAGLWLHVDAAYGWTAVLTAEGRQELAGIERADSVTLDPHKWLAQTFDAGCVLVRQGKLLEQTFSSRPEYLQDVAPTGDEVNFADRGIALTRRFRALKIWLSIEVLGLDWFRKLVAHCCRLAAYAQALLESAGEFEILSPHRLSIVCFRHAPSNGGDPDAHNLALVEAIRATGRAFLSSTRLHGKVAIRFCFVNWRTTAADVEEVVTLLVEEGRKC